MTRLLLFAVLIGGTPLGALAQSPSLETEIVSTSPVAEAPGFRWVPPGADVTYDGPMADYGIAVAWDTQKRPYAMVEKADGTFDFLKWPGSVTFEDKFFNSNQIKHFPGELQGTLQQVAWKIAGLDANPKEPRAYWAHLDTLPVYIHSTSRGDDLGFSDAEIARLTDALARWDDAIALDFDFVDEPVSCSEGIYLRNDPSNPYSTGYGSKCGLVLNGNKDWTQDEASYRHWGVMHELGHVFGNAHTGYQPFSNDPSFFSPHVDAAWITVASYRATGDPEHDAPSRAATSVGPADFIWLETGYGLDPDTRTGDTHYGCNADPKLDANLRFGEGLDPMTAIYDAGGADTLDVSCLSGPHVLSAVPLTPMSVGGDENGRWRRNVWLAPQTRIERFIGGPGEDVVIVPGDAMPDWLTLEGVEFVQFAGTGEKLTLGDLGGPTSEPEPTPEPEPQPQAVKIPATAVLTSDGNLTITIELP